MHDRGKSDGPVVPAKPPNNAAVRRRRRWREGGRPRGTRPAKRAPDTEPGMSASSELDRVRRVARKDKDARFTALLHHVDVDRLRAAYSGDPPERRAGGRRGDVAGLRAGSRGEPSGSARSGPQRARTGRSRLGGRTSRRPTGGCGRSGSPRWRTRSSSGRWSRC